VLAAFSPTPAMLIAARAVLGVAGATLMPSTLSLIRNMFHDPRQRTVAIGIWTTSFSIGGILGPMLGGLLLQYFWWGSVFLLAVPAMALLLLLGPLLLPEFRVPEGGGRIDLPSAGLSLCAVLAVIFGIKRIAEHGPSATAALVIAAGIVLGAVFVRRQHRLADPLIDLGLFRARAFSTALGVNIFAFLVMYGVFLFFPQYLQLVLGLSPLRAGFWMLPSSCAFIVGSLLTPVVVKWVRPSLVVAAGLLLSAVGLLIVTRVDGPGGFEAVIGGSIVLLLGLAPVYILATDMIVASAPPERAGAAGAMSETSAELGGALGIAILGSIGTAVYRGRMAGTVPVGIPPDGTEAAKATLGGALAVAERLSGAAGTDLLARARDAFVQGVELVAAVSAAVLVVTAIGAVIVLRNGEGKAS
jgi:MFS transporter, DHA2 family, multidrug resistance protein